MTQNDAIQPHGAILCNRMAEPANRDVLVERARSLPKVALDERSLSDLEMIAVGTFSPLTGFMGREAYHATVEDMRLPSGLPWTIPITLRCAKDLADTLREGTDVALADGDRTVAVLALAERFRPDKEREAERVYRTTERAHPGVAYLSAHADDIYLAGEVQVIERPLKPEFPAYHRDPAETRKIFRERGWKRIVAFQTRNPVHRAHEYLQKCALEVVDGLLLHPLVGATKSDDIPAAVRMRCYEVLIESYYPADRVLLSVLPAAMRYAGPREAVFHAIMRKNYGCTHFIVGRDHAGVGKYYGTFDAHKIFDEFRPEELAIQPMFFDNSFFCAKCGSMATVKTCPHPEADHVSLSGTRVREMLAKGELPPPEFSRPEVARILIDSMRPAS